MTKQPCDQYIEWMSLAQDGMLSSTQMHVLHTHLVACPPCQIQWEAMNFVSRMLHAAPMIAPESGFVTRFQVQLAYREEKRRRILIWVLLGIGVITLTFLALPSVLGALWFTGHVILPYEVFAYVQGVLRWVNIVATGLVDAAWVLIRHFASPPAALACIGSTAMAGVLALLWMRLMFRRPDTQRVRATSRRR